MSLILFAFCSIPALAPAAVFIVGPSEAPPPPRSEPVRARHGYVWVGGHYGWHRHRYHWTRGHWERERPGYVWRDGDWRSGPRAYEWHPGHWEPAR
jgi:hypothetical protein